MITPRVKFEKQFGDGVDPWHAKAERWAKKQKFPISFLALAFIEWLKQKWIDVKVANTMRDIDRQSEEIKKIFEKNKLNIKDSKKIHITKVNDIQHNYS